MRFVLDEFHPALPAGRLKVNDFGDLTGVKGGPISRLSNPEFKKTARPETFKKIADAAGVSYVWLSLGEGQPGDPNPWGEGYSPELETAVAYHQSEFSEATIARARQLAKRGQRHTPREWGRRLRELQLEVLREAQAEDAEAAQFTERLGETLAAMREGDREEAAPAAESSPTGRGKRRRAAARLR